MFFVGTEIACLRVMGRSSEKSSIDSKWGILGWDPGEFPYKISPK